MQEVTHDKAGDDIQYHALDNGDGLLTFSDSWLEAEDFRPGDTIVLSVEDDSLIMRNVSKTERKGVCS